MTASPIIYAVDGKKQYVAIASGAVLLSFAIPEVNTATAEKEAK